MKMKIIATVSITAALFVSGCATTTTTTTNPQVENNVTKELLKSSPVYAQKNQHKAVEENMVKIKNDMPLYRQPLFAQMVVFPYISDAGIYHGYQESWIKIKDGEFVLADSIANPKDEKIFDYNKASQ